MLQDSASYVIGDLDANFFLPSENDKQTYKYGATLGSLAQPWILFEDP